MSKEYIQEYIYDLREKYFFKKGKRLIYLTTLHCQTSVQTKTLKTKRQDKDYERYLRYV